jgi:hypothetical protein
MQKFISFISDDVSMHDETSMKSLCAFVTMALLILPCAAYGDQGKKSQYASQMLELQMVTMTCRDNYTTGYLNDVVSVINNATITSTLSSTDLPKIGSDFTTLQSDATADNAAQFKIDVKTFNADAKTANLDSHSEIKMVHNKTVYSSLKSDLSQLKSTYNDCLFGVKQQYAQLKGQMFANSISHLQNMTNRLGLHGENTTALDHTINLANGNIQKFEAAVNSAQNKTQLEGALKSFCLYNGCKTDSNFHLAATAAIQQNQAKLNFLAAKNTSSSYQSLVTQAQADLTSAQTTLSQVGSNQYQGTQSSDIWKSIQSAADLIHQLQQIVNHKH